MAGQRERSPQERETLIFASPEEAKGFQERVRKQQEQQQKIDVKDDRAGISAALQQEFVQQGESVRTVKDPWEHSPQEHEEAQRLVNVAFEKDLSAAVKEARKSKHYPRNLDLVHDVMTGELYEVLKEHRVNKQPLEHWLIGISIGAGILLLIFLGLLWLGLR